MDDQAQQKCSKAAMSDMQLSLLLRLVNEKEEYQYENSTKRGVHLTQMQKRWQAIAIQLNNCRGPMKKPYTWRKNYMRNYYKANPKRLICGIVPIHYQSSADFLFHATELTNAKLKSLAAILKQPSEKYTVCNLRQSATNKLRFLLNAGDRIDMVPESQRMAIADWLLFDNLLVHENLDVTTNSNFHKTIQSVQCVHTLLDLVQKYQINCLKGEQLAEAWAALTLEYNIDNRQCTPMLLQRRWYQLKLNAIKQFYAFYAMSDADPFILKDIKCKPSPFEIEIVTRYPKLVLELFTPWEQQIKDKTVILREQFESIAMNKNKMTPNVSPIVITVDLSPALDESNTKDPIEFETVMIKQETGDIYIDESVSSEEQQHHTWDIEVDDPFQITSDSSTHIDIPIKKEDNTTGVTNDGNNSIDIKLENNYEMTIDECNVGNYMEVEIPPYNDVTLSADTESLEMSINNAITVSEEQEALLPKITNIFGNVHVPIENLASVLISVTDNTTQMATTPKISDRLDVTVRNDDVNSYETSDKKENEVLPTMCKSPNMSPIENTVKLEDTDVSPVHLLTHVNSKAIIDNINFKSKPKRRTTVAKFKCENDPNPKRVDLSSVCFKGSRNHTYDTTQLSKNPDFNITLKKLNHRFFRSYSNRKLLRSCKPLCIYVDKAFENELVNGRMYIKPSVSTVFTHVVKSPEPIKLQEEGPTVSGAELDPHNIKSTTDSLLYQQTSDSSAQTTILEKLLSATDSCTVSAITNPLSETNPVKTEVLTTAVYSCNNSASNTLSSINKQATNPNKTNGFTKATETDQCDNGSIKLLNINDLNRLLSILADKKRYNFLNQNGKYINHTRPLEENSECRQIVNVTNNINKRSNQYTLQNLFPNQSKLYEANKYISTQATNNTRQEQFEQPLHTPEFMPSDREKLSDTPIDKFISLGKNKIILTTTKFPKNFKAFVKFKHYVKKTLNLPKHVWLVLLPNGKVILTRDLKGYVSPKTLLELIALTTEFNCLTEQQTNNGKNNKVNKKNCNKIPNMVSIKEFLDIKDYFKVDDARNTNNLITEHTLNTDKSVIPEDSNINLNPSPKVNDTNATKNDNQNCTQSNIQYTDDTIHNTSKNKLPTQIVQSLLEKPMTNIKKDSPTLSKMQSCLGSLFCKSLSPITVVSQLKYAYSQNGLFFKLDLNNESFKPLNICLKGNLTPFEDFAVITDDCISTEPSAFIPPAT